MTPTPSGAPVLPLARLLQAVLFVTAVAAVGTVDGVEYTDPVHGFRVQHPAQWVVDSPTPATRRFWSRPDFAEFVVPNSGGLRRGVFTVTVTVSAAPGGAALDAYSPRQSLLRSAERVVATREILVGGVRALQDHLVRTGPFDALLATYVARGTQVYAITLDYSAASNADEAMEAYQSFVASFTFTR